MKSLAMDRLATPLQPSSPLESWHGRVPIEAAPR